MAMVDRYKKAGGFIQLLQVIETCGPKKREQLMKIIQQETPKWADAINLKMLSFDKILSWKAEAIMEITASMNILAFSTALKSLNEQDLNTFLDKLGPQEKRKIEQQCKEINPTPNEISACLMKVINETRLLIVSGALKMDKVDPNLVIPDDYENLLERSSVASSAKSHLTSVVSESESSTMPDTSSISLNTAVSGIASAHASSTGELDSLRRKIVELTLQIQNLKKENLFMKDKLDRIKKIA